MDFTNVGCWVEIKLTRELDAFDDGLDEEAASQIDNGQTVFEGEISAMYSAYTAQASYCPRNALSTETDNILSSYKLFILFLLWHTYQSISMFSDSSTPPMVSYQ